MSFLTFSSTGLSTWLKRYRWRRQRRRPRLLLLLLRRRRHSQQQQQQQHPWFRGKTFFNSFLTYFFKKNSPRFQIQHKSRLPRDYSSVAGKIFFFQNSNFFSPKKAFSLMRISTNVRKSCFFVKMFIKNFTVWRRHQNSKAAWVKRTFVVVALFIYF